MAFRLVFGVDEQGGSQEGFGHLVEVKGGVIVSLVLAGVFVGLPVIGGFVYPIVIALLGQHFLLCRC